MGIVAPISAASPVVPLAVDGVAGTLPTYLQWIGIALVLTGIVAISREPAASSGERLATGAGLAIVAALGFGLFIVGIDAGSDESAVWAVVAARCASVSLACGAAVLMATSLRPPTTALPLLVGIGVFDTSANVLVATATTVGSAGTVAVLSAMYPVVTVVLARMLLGERLTAIKRVGGIAAVAGAMLVAAG
jgi:drug/metabolite transporter (DMT)-like permease